MKPRGLWIANRLGNQVQSGRAEKIEIVIHRCQRRPKKLRFRHIIETDDGDLAGDLDPVLPESLHGTESDLIITRYQRRKARSGI